ncbi:hypothetical protein [Streptomyces hydrogenans]|nr:hypothetical protein [Streptomyces hydrogenans]
MRAVPLTAPERTVPVGLVVSAREPAPVPARALTGLADGVDVAGALEHLPGEA